MNPRIDASATTDMSARTVTDVTCLGCGCACDDIDVAVEGDRIAEARNACALGAEWFGDGQVPARVLVGGREAPMTHAVAIATQLLVDARRALVYLAPGVSCEAQRASAAVADLLGGLLDSITTATTLS